MYIGEGTLKAISEDSKYLNWLEVNFINEHKSEIKFSNNLEYTINKSCLEIYNIFKDSEYFALPPVNECSEEFLIINKHNLEKVTNNYIVFNDGTMSENEYGNSDVVIDMYQLPFNDESYNY